MTHKGLIFALLCSQALIAADITWNAISPANDLNTDANWSPATVPTNTDNALFNSSVPGIATNPTAGADFSVLSLNFINGASAFSFAFNNCNVTFTGIGIQGAQTNANVAWNNVNNTNTLFDQVDFAGPSSSSGAAIFSFVNSGSAAGTNSGVIFSSLSDAQLHSANDFTIASNGSLSFFNVGTDDSTDGGNNTLAQVGSQAIFAGPVVVGNHGTLNIINSGTNNNTTSTTSNGDRIAKIPNDQLNINSLTAGDNFNLSVSNLGTNNYAGIGMNEIAYVNSHQLTIGSAQIGSNAVISFLNSGVGASTNASAAQAQGIVGKIGGKQLNCSGPFVSGDSLELFAANNGDDTSNAVGSGEVGNVDAQLFFGDSFTTGQSSSITLINSGTNSMTNAAETDPVIATSANPQMYVTGNFKAGKSLELSAVNSGTDNSSGLGGNNTGFIASSQFQTDGSFTVGDNAFISLGNSGTKTGSSPNISVGFVSNDQFVSGAFSAGNNLSVTASNIGTNIGVNNGLVGFVQHDILHFSDTFDALDNVSISVSNTGSNTQGSDVTVGSVQRFLLQSDAAFTAGDNFELSVSNSGTDTSGGANNKVGATIDGYEAYFASDVTLGKNATINVSNSGSYTGSDTNCLIGFTQDQFLVSGTFRAEENLSITVTNTAVNPNHVPNVGSTINQLLFLGPSHFKDGTVLSVVNSGDGVVASQLTFAVPFTLEGKATFSAINEGTAGTGIFTDNTLGGDINIILQNSSLFGSNSILATPFTMGALNGDATSTATGDPGFIINTDVGVDAHYAGRFFGIMNLPIVVIKDGPGTQTLSGTNTFDGLTTVQGGTLVLNGSITCPLNVTALGTLKGTGTVGGAVTNSGTISPGQSIGTINFLTTFANNGGNYDAEVSGAGQSDLILVGGAATLNGGKVVVSTVDGTFRFLQPYTILQAASVAGTFTGATSTAFIRPTLTYDPQHVFLTITPDLARAAITRNQRAVAGQIDNLTGATAAQLQLINAIANLPQGAARDALTSLSGYQHTFDLLTTGIINRQFIRRLYDPLRFIVTRTPDCCCDPCCCNEFSIWLEGGGSQTHISGNRNAPGLNLNGWELTLGLQDTFCQNFTVGVAGSFDHENYHFKNNNGSGHSDTWFVGAYGLYRPTCFYGLLDFAWGFSSNDLSRRIHLGGFSTHAISHPNTHQFTFYGELGVDFCACNLLIQPFFGVETNLYRRRHVREHNSNNWGLNVRQREHNNTYLRVGSHFTNTCQLPGNIDISVDLAWNGRLNCGNNKVRVQFNDFGTPFNVRGIKLDSSVDYAITLSTDYCCCWRFYLQGSGETWNHAQEFGYLAGIEYKW